MAYSPSDPYQALRCGDFQFRADVDDEVTLGNLYADSIRGVEELLRRDLLESQRASLTASIRMMRQSMQEQGRFGDYVLVSWGGHSLRITAIMSDQQPHDLRRQLEDVARRTIAVEDLLVGGIPGVAYERHQEPIDGLSWWLSKGGCLIMCNLQGATAPTAAAVAHVRAILATLVHAPPPPGTN